jgi:TolB protein
MRIINREKTLNQRRVLRMVFGLIVICISVITQLVCTRGNKLAEQSQRQIIFDSNRSGNTEIYAINADGSGLQQLTHSGGEGRYSRVPAWSPDGERLAFCSNVSNREGTWDIYTMKADGSDVQRLTHVTDERIANQGPDWSPDGKKIAFHSTRDVTFEENKWNEFEIYVMDVDGTNIPRLTFNVKFDAHPDW